MSTPQMKDPRNVSVEMIKQFENGVYKPNGLDYFDVSKIGKPNVSNPDLYLKPYKPKREKSSYHRKHRSVVKPIAI